MNRQPFKSDRDLEKARKHNRFHRQESLNDTIHSIHITVVRLAPWVFSALLILILFEPLLPNFVNTPFVEKALFAIGGALFSTLLSRIQEQTL